MKIIKHIFTGLLVCLPVQGFQTDPITNHVQRALNTPEYAFVDEFVDQWTDLEKRQRDLERNGNPDDVRNFGKLSRVYNRA